LLNAFFMDENLNLLKGYRYLVDIARDLASTLELDVLLSRIIHAAVQITNAEAASILLYDQDEQQLFFQATTNLEPPLMRGLIVPLEGSIAGWIVLNRQIVRTKDVHSDPRHFGKIEKVTSFNTESLIGLPLITKDKVIGVLEVLNKKSGDFDETDENLLTGLAAQAAVAIENTRLFHQSDMIAEFVHELRTPLTSMSAAAYLLNKPGLADELRGQLMQSIHEESTRLNDLATSFLDLARLESGRVQYHVSKFELLPLLEECSILMQARADENTIQINLSIPGEVPPIEADRDKIKQVVMNLISNAIKYNSTGGWVNVETETRNNEIVILIKDNGIGIPASSMPHLFEKFYRVKSSEETAVGTGLGLSICRKIIQGHGGHIEVQSEPGIGTTFSVYIPRYSKKSKDQ
jgi:signal transduction histidine kinase